MDWIDRAGEVVDTVFRRARVTSGLQPEDVEDARASILLRILERIQSRDGDAIRNFDDFVAKAAFHGVDDLMRKRYPARARLKNRVRYSIGRDPRFTIAPSGHSLVCGLLHWPRLPAAAPLDRRTATARMLDASRPAAALHEIVAALGRPVPIDELVDIVSELWQVPRDGAPTAMEPDIGRVADHHPIVAAAMESRQSLRMLWDEILEIPQRQRVALLLHARDDDRASAIALLIFSGVASAAAVAETLGLTEEMLESLWDDLPLDDNRIGDLLGATRQEVINLRKSARERLARRRGKRGF